MGIARDLTDLPRRGGDVPDPDPKYGHLLAEAWSKRDTHLPHAVEGSRFRHSMAGACSRAVAYEALGADTTNPMDLTGYHNTGFGHIGHEQLQQVLVERFGDAVSCEVKVSTVGAPGSGHIDFVHDTGDVVRAGEIKFVGGFKFKMAVGERGDAKGPGFDHRLQASLNALAAGADEAVIVYISKEALSVRIAERKGFSEVGRFVAEWTLPRDVFEPLARAEADRVSKILAVVDGGELPRRVFADPDVPRGHEVVDVTSGRWEVRQDGEVVNTGSWWACDYCRFRDRCAEDGPGRVAIR